MFDQAQRWRHRGFVQLFRVSKIGNCSPVCKRLVCQCKLRSLSVTQHTGHSSPAASASSASVREFHFCAWVLDLPGLCSVMKSTSSALLLFCYRCSCSPCPHHLPRWWRCRWKSACVNATLWRLCSLSPPQPSTTPAGSSERGCRRPKLDRVRSGTWLV